MLSDIIAVSDGTRIPIGLIDPSPSRARASLPDIEELAHSIARYSLLQPVVVRRQGPRYALLNGHRRLAAYKLLHDLYPADPRWQFIAAAVRGVSDDMAYVVSLVAEVHHAELTAAEQAAALERLSEGRTNAEIAKLLHRSEAWVFQRLATYRDPIVAGPVQAAVLPVSTGQELRAIRDVGRRRAAVNRAVSERWSQSQARQHVREIRATDERRGQAHACDALRRQVKDLTARLSRITGDDLDDSTLRSLSRLGELIQRLEPTGRPAA
jgi:ParB family chromosome partitioning protein